MDLATKVICSILILFIIGAVCWENGRENKMIQKNRLDDSLINLQVRIADSIGRQEVAVKMARDSASADSFRKTPAYGRWVVENKNNQAIIEKRDKKLRGLCAKFGCSVEDAQNVLDHKIWIGMTYDMVVYERGRPDVLNMSIYGNGNLYQACWEGYTPFCFYFKASDDIIYAYN